MSTSPKKQPPIAVLGAGELVSQLHRGEQVSTTDLLIHRVSPRIQRRGYTFDACN